MNKLTILLHRFWNQLTTQGLLMTAWAGFDTIARSLTGKPVRRLSQITPKIYVGGQPAKSFWKTLSSEWGVAGVVNMRGEYDYSQIVNPMGLPLKWLHLPTVDTEAPSLEHLQQGVNFIQEVINETDQGVYIHCWEGLGRGPSMAAAYFVSQGITPEQAWDKIKESRPFIRPTDIQKAQLEAFAEGYTTETSKLTSI